MHVLAIIFSEDYTDGMISYATALQDGVSQLPPSVEQIGLNLNGFHVVRGLTNDLAAQLAVRSREDAVLRFWPNDAEKRFKDIEAVKDWQAKGRLSLPLVTMKKDAMHLVGFGWMGPGTPTEDELFIPGAETTFAIRLYNGAASRIAELPYARAILGAHEALHGNRGVWLETWADNTNAIKTYERAGFKMFSQVPGRRHGERHNRLYMTLGTIAA